MIIGENTQIEGSLEIWTSATISSAGVGSFQSLEVSPTGLKFPDNAFGGSGDTAGIRLVTRGTENQSLEIYTTNDADDWVNLTVPDNNAAKVNGNTIWNAGNFDPTSKSDIGHVHDDRYYTESEINSLLSGKLERVPTLITNLSANSFNDNGIYAGYDVINAPNTWWGILRVWNVPGDSGDQVWQEWRTASYGDSSVWKRGSYDYGATWTSWIRDLDTNIDSSLLINSHTHSNKSILDVINQSLAISATPIFTGLLTSAISLYPNAAQIYDGSNIPPNWIGQVMAGNDGWKIYGEGTDNAGRLVFEVNDDVSEGLVFKQRMTYAPYTTNTHTIWHSGNFDPSSKSDVGHTHSILNITDRVSQYVDDNFDVGTAKMLRWKNYGDGHEIIDASQGLSPTGSTISNGNSDMPWAPTYPTLMGWNGVNTYGVRVDRSRYSDNADALEGHASSYFATAEHNHDATYLKLIGGDMTGSIQFGLVGNGAASPAINFNGAIPSTSYKWMLGDTSDGTGLSIFVNGSARVTDGGVNATTIRNERGSLVLGYIGFATNIVGSDVQANGNSIWHAGNFNPSLKSDVGHIHDDRYYTESEITALLSGKQNTLGFIPVNKAGDTGVGTIEGSDGSRIKFRKDVSLNTSDNSKYADAPVVVERLADDGTSEVAGIGFHNRGINGSLLFYDPATSVFKYNRHLAGAIITLWDSSNLTNLNQLTNGPGYISGNQTITLSGIVTGSGTTSITTAIADGALSIAKTSGLQSAINSKLSDYGTITGTVDFNNILSGTRAIVSIFATTGTSNNPPGTSSGGGQGSLIQDYGANSTDWRTQLYVNAQSDYLQFRTMHSNATWEPWHTVWHDGNLTPSNYSLTGHSHNVKDLSWSTPLNNSVLDYMENGISDSSTGSNGIHGGWSYQLKMLHSNDPASWQFVLAVDFFTDSIGFRRKQATWQSPQYLWHTGNFTPANKSDVGHTHSILNITDRYTEYNDDNFDVGTAKMLRWKNYGDGHVVFDASQGISPNGLTIGNSNSDMPWAPSYPTLMGWNGNTTYGVRVDRSRYSDNADALEGHAASYFAVSGHIHDDRYYTESETNLLLSDKSNVGHTHSILNITDRASVYTDDNYDVGTAKMLRWKKYGDNHQIFDASNGTAPDGTAINNSNPEFNWDGTYPTLMGWNGVNTYGVRVDRSRYSDNADALEGHAASYFATAGHNHNVKDLAWSTNQADGILNNPTNGITDSPDNTDGLFTSWAYHFKMLHSANPADWQFLLAADFYNDSIGFRRKANGSWQAQQYLWHTGHFTQTNINNWNTAYTSAHFHTNKSNLDTINQNLSTTSQVTFADVSATGAAYVRYGYFGTHSGWVNGTYAMRVYGDSIFIGNATVNTDSQLFLTKDVTPTTASNTKYSSAPLVINRTSITGTSTAAGLGFHNQGVNAAFLYYDATTSVFKYNRDTAGALVTIWDDSNFTPGNYLPKSGSFGGSDGYIFEIESGSDSGGLSLRLTDDSDGTEYFVVRNNAGDPSLIANSDRTVNIGYQNYQQVKPILSIGDQQYGIGANSGYLDLYSAGGGFRAFSKSGSSDAVFVGNFWHSGNFNPSSKSDVGHIHDDRYYTESETNSILGNYLPLTGGTMTGNIVFSDADEGVEFRRGAKVGNIGSYLTLRMEEDNNNPRLLSNNGATSWTVLTTRNVTTTTNYIPRFVGTGGLNEIQMQNSLISDDGTNVTINGAVSASGQINSNLGFRTTGYGVQSWTGPGLELHYTTATNRSRILSFNRTSTLYEDLEIRSKNLVLSTQAGTSAFIVDASGDIRIKEQMIFDTFNKPAILFPYAQERNGDVFIDFYGLMVKNYHLGGGQGYSYSTTRIVDSSPNGDQLTSNVGFEINTHNVITASTPSPTISFGQLWSGGSGLLNDASGLIVTTGSFEIQNINAISHKPTPLLTASTILNADITYYTISASANRNITLPSIPRTNTIYYLNVIDETYQYTLVIPSNHYIFFRDLTNASVSYGSGTFAPKLKAGLHLLSCYFNGTNYLWTLDGQHAVV